MELGELIRTMARYGWLILAFVAVAVGLAALVHAGDPTTYTASTRLVLDTPDPESRAEAAAIGDTAKALATSPSQVRAALRRAGVTGRNPDQVAREHVSVRPLGSSAIVQVSVTDRSPAGAASISNALAAEIIDTRLGVTTGENKQVLAALDRRLADMNQRIAALDARIAALTVAAAGASSSALDEAERSRDLLTQQRGLVEAQRGTLLSNEALRPKPAIISRATPPTSADPSRLLPDMLLAGVLALILGLGLAGLVETLRGTVSGGGTLARAFSTTLLGTIRANPAREGAFDGGPGIAMRLRLAAEAMGVTDVRLFSVGRPLATSALAERLEREAAEAAGLAPTEQMLFARTGETGPMRMTATADFTRSGHARRRLAESAAPPSIKPFGAPGMKTDGPTGLVVVSPTRLGKAELSEVVQLVQGTSLPMLGLIAVEADAAPISRLNQSVLGKLERLRRTA